MKTFYIFLVVSLSLRLFRQDQTHSGWIGGKQTLFLVPTQDSKNKYRFIQSSSFELLNNNIKIPLDF